MSALALIFAGACASSADAQDNRNPFRDPARPMPPLKLTDVQPPDAAVAARLDGLAAAKDWKALREAALPKNDVKALLEALRWLKVRTMEGNSFFIGYIYVRNLWLLSDELQAKGENPDGMRRQAAFIGLYTMAQIRMDGMACADKTAPQHQVDELASSELGAALRYWKTTPVEFREEAVRAAVQLEAQNAGHRAAEDPAVCSGGMDEMDAALKAGTVGEGKTVPGHIGKVHEVSPPPGWKPSFLPASDYKAKQDKERGAALYDYLYPPEIAAMKAADPAPSGSPQKVPGRGNLGDPAIALALKVLPESRSSEVTSATILYTFVAKAWWLDTRCHISQPTEAEKFKSDVAAFTGGMRALYRKSFDVPEEKAQEYVEKVQMYQLESLSAAQFYSCGAEAKAAYDVGVGTIRRMGGKPQ
jgi:hypothetical protein